MGFLLVDVVWSPLSSQKKSLLSPLKLMHMGRPAGRPYQTGFDDPDDRMKVVGHHYKLIQLYFLADD
jgi:hypothetical protein